MKFFRRILYWCVFFSAVLYAQPGTSSQLLPADNSQYISIEPVYFEWSPVDSAEFYEIYIDDQPIFSSLVHEEIVYGLSKEMYGLFSNWNFYWKVRAGRENDSGEQEFGEWSETFSFTSTYEPAENFSPLDGSIDEEFLNIMLEWEMHLDPSIEGDNNNYLVQVSATDQFSNIIFEESVINTKTTVVGDLEQNSEYFWRVKYSNDFGESAWSIPTQFKTKLASLEQVELQSPENVTIGLFPLNIEFEWQPVTAAEGYVFELATDSTFNNVIESAAVLETDYSTSLLHYNKTLYWRVQAEQGIDKSPWSTVWSFTTSMAAPQTPPNLISPIDSLNFLDLQNLPFSWSNVYGAEKYMVQIAGVDDFSEMLFDTTLTDTGIVVADVFENNKNYYWRVMGTNILGDGPWSSSQNFSFGTVTHIDEIIFESNSFNLVRNYPNPFNPSTTIEFKALERSQVVLSIYDILGQKIRTLKDGIVNPGAHHFKWDGTNSFGSQASSGVFFYRLEIKELQSEKRRIVTKRMIKIK